MVRRGLLSPPTVPENRPQDLVSGEDRTPKGAGDLGNTDPFSIADRHFGDSHPVAERFDLHLSGPAEVGVVHFQLFE